MVRFKLAGRRLEVRLGRWLRADPPLFRVFAGRRRIDGLPFVGPVRPVRVSDLWPRRRR